MSDDKRSDEELRDEAVRLLEIAMYAVTKHVSLKPVVEDRTDPATSVATVGGSVPYHVVVEDLLKAALIISIGCMAKGGEAKPKLLGIRSLRELLDECVKSLAPAEEIAPFCKWFVEEAAVGAAQFLTGNEANEPSEVKSEARLKIGDETRAAVEAEAAQGGE